MKSFVVLFLALMILLPSCNIREREKQIEQKLSSINQKEQELILWERTLQLREQEVRRLEKEIDSTKAIGSDSAFIYNPGIVGNWSVKMNCIETNCPGSAVGDTKVEQWAIAYQGDAVIARASAGKELVRVYTGKYYGNILQLTAQQDDTSASMAAKIVVRLQEVQKNNLEGRREITRPENCRIVYSLELKKS